MATETTLGGRILYEVYRVAPFMSGGARATLRAIAARAAAAERLAVALSPLGLHICDDEPGADEVNAAMEAWWAIERAVQP